MNGQASAIDFQHAELHSYSSVHKLVRNLEVIPSWNDNSLTFKNENVTGYRFRCTELSAGKTREAFNHYRLAELLAERTGKEISPDSLPVQNLHISADNTKITFNDGKTSWEYNTLSDFLTRISTRPINKNESYSPDSTVKVFVKDYNLWMARSDTGEEVQLTTDGRDHYDYATYVSWWQVNELDKGEIYSPEIEITWSPDSKKFIFYRLDRRRVRNMYLLQSVPDSGWRAKVHYYERDLPGEDSTEDLEYFVFDLEKNTRTSVAIRPFPSYLVNTGPGWFNDNKRIFFSKFARGYNELDYYVIDAVSGRVDTLFTERAATMVEYQMAFGEKTKDDKYLIWASERDGWSHLYLYDLAEKKLVNQITKGEFVVRSIVSVDEKTRTVWFLAGGREEGRDPYLTHLYRVRFDGKQLTLLTLENANHDIHVSPDGKYFVDNCSRIDMPTVSTMRRMIDGKVIAFLQEADASELLKSGFRFPEPFVTKARDGITDIYGAVFFPYNFDPSEKYPVIDASYTGPQAVRTPKNFKSACRNNDIALSDIGFIVVTIDGMGTAMRSKAFHNVSYKNLGDIGAPDHIKALKHLAEERSYIDIDRVGIYGHSAGAYDAVHAMLIHPEFYKAAFAMAGNHDNMMSKAWWDEQYMGLPGEHYKQQSNLELAKNLRGKLFLVHGDMDQNVNPANTVRLAGELIKNDKDFDMLIVPNVDHGIIYDRYVNRRMWIFFARNLLGIEPALDKPMP